MSLGLIAGVALPILTGAALVVALGPARQGRSAWLVRACLSILLGFGFHAAWQFLWFALTAGSVNRLALLGFDSIPPLAAIVSALLVLRRRQRSACPPLRQAVASPALASTSPLAGKWPGHWDALLHPALTTLLCVGFVFALWLSGAIAFIVAHQLPHGYADAWGIWNFKARFMVLGGPRWSEMVRRSADVVHPTYPLLLSLTIARLWIYAGGIPPVVPQLVSVAASALIVVSLVSGLAALRGLAAGLVAGIVLLCYSSFSIQAGWQYADAPLAAFNLAAMILLAMAWRSPKPERGLLALAGLAAGCSAWTKDEGTLFFVALVFFFLVVTGMTEGWLAAIKRLGWFLLGSSPMLIALVFLKSMAASSNEIFTHQATLGAAAAKLMDPGRHRVIWRTLEAMWNLHRLLDWKTVALLVIYALLAGFTRDRRARSTGIVAAGAAAACALGFYCIYLITPFDLNWHVGTTADRLFLQLWPLLVFGFFMGFRSPLEWLSQAKPEPGEIGAGKVLESGVRQQ